MTSWLIVEEVGRRFELGKGERGEEEWKVDWREWGWKGIIGDGWRVLGYTKGEAGA